MWVSALVDPLHGRAWGDDYAGRIEVVVPDGHRHYLLGGLLLLRPDGGRERQHDQGAERRPEVNQSLHGLPSSALLFDTFDTLSAMTLPV